MTQDEWKKKARRYTVEFGEKIIGEVVALTKAEAAGVATCLKGWRAVPLRIVDHGLLYKKDLWELPNV